MLAEALRRDGWSLRSSVIWTKNALPESVTSRPSMNYEFVFLLAKSSKTQFWVHEHGRGTRIRPVPDYVWRDRATDQDLAYEPVGWKEKEQFEGKPRFARRNLWEGCRYFYDAEAVRTPSKDYGGIKDRNGAEKERHNGAPPHQGLTNADCSSTGANLRAVWYCPNEPFPGRHFATFPVAIPTVAFKAGASAGGCCPKCQAPRWPLVERGQADLEWQRECGGDEEGEYDGESTKDHDEDGVQDASAVKARILAGMVRREVKGWFPTCDCPSADPVPCLVGDVFLGSGRSGRAAVALGHDFVGIELVPSYCDMARQNIADPLWEKKERARIKAEKEAAEAAQKALDASVTIFAAAEGSQTS